MQEYAYANTTGGPLRGLSTESIYVFKGIPYGATTAGSARFMAPRPPEPWKGTRDALQFGPACPQLDPAINDEIAELMRGGFEERSYAPNEDCLVLNIWSAGLRDNVKRPVMVWCHGGRFSEGSGAGPWSDGTALVRREDVVVVSFNHRLNALGFLHLGDLGGADFAASGNAGMLDIIAVLQWIRDNITEFGGDPNNVTLFGNSGGGCKINVLMAMPSAKGLFHKAIVQSGTLRHMAASRERRTLIAQTLLENLGLRSHQLTELQQAPIADLQKAMIAVERQLGDPFSMGVFGPTLDGYFLAEVPFDPCAPKISNDIPLLIGTTRDEMSLMLGNIAMTTDTLPIALQQLAAIDVNTAARWIDLYLSAQPDATPNEIFIAIASDFVMRCDAIAQADRKSLQSAPVYTYQFTWPVPACDGKYRAAHGMEVPFVFANVDKAPGFGVTPAQYVALEEKICRAWGAFARTGNPNHDGLPHWPSYQINRRSTMLLDNTCEVVNDSTNATLTEMLSTKFG
jgi:para-nitrobenzyl esterase